MEILLQTAKVSAEMYHNIMLGLAQDQVKSYPLDLLVHDLDSLRFAEETGVIRRIVFAHSPVGTHTFIFIDPTSDKTVAYNKNTQTWLDATLLTYGSHYDVDWYEIQHRYLTLNVFGTTALAVYLKKQNTQNFE